MHGQPLAQGLMLRDERRAVSCPNKAACLRSGAWSPDVFHNEEVWQEDLRRICRRALAELQHRTLPGVLHLAFLSQCGLPYLVLLKKAELCVP